ncbi:MAG: NADH-quinone oxidoreductase subunit J [Anaerolineae bacterium]|nr:NADH-quinone oxidoreductase subunit J [Anaerolineae bacterium]
MGLETFLFIIVGAVAVAAAAGMLFSKSGIHSALFLVLNLACVAVFYLMLSAPFMAMVQITVYAGAIMVLFLFVIMLLGSERIDLGLTDRRLGFQTPAAFALAVLFIVVVAAAVLTGQIPAPQPVNDVQATTHGGPGEVGAVLYTRYLLPFEMVAVLLLAATIGAVVLARDVIPTKRSQRAQMGRIRELRQMITTIETEAASAPGADGEGAEEEAAAPAPAAPAGE